MPLSAGKLAALVITASTILTACATNDGFPPSDGIEKRSALAREIMEVEAALEAERRRADAAELEMRRARDEAAWLGRAVQEQPIPEDRLREYELRIAELERANASLRQPGSNTDELLRRITQLEEQSKLLIRDNMALRHAANTPPGRERRLAAALPEAGGTPGYELYQDAPDGRSKVGRRPIVPVPTPKVEPQPLPSAEVTATDDSAITTLPDSSGTVTSATVAREESVNAASSTANKPPPTRQAYAPPNQRQEAVVPESASEQLSPQTGTAPSKGRYGLHIASYRKMDELQRGWQIFKLKHRDIVGNLGANAVLLDLAGLDGVFYRLVAGPLPDQVEARRSCERLSLRGEYCIVSEFDPEGEVVE